MRMYGEFAALYDPLMAEVDYDNWAEYIASFLPGEGLSIAECGCGTGELTVRLARRGHALTGVDISEEMLMVAAEKARRAGLRIPFVRQDMRRLSLHRPQDAVISACDGVNYLASLEEAAEFFRAAHDCLKPGGLLLFDVSSEYKLSRVLGENTFAEDDGERAYIWRNCYDPQSRLIEMRLSFFAREGGLYRRFEETHIQRAHRQEELLSQLREAGFEGAAYGCFTREAPGPDCQRIQFAARRRP